ncbi:RNA-directed DNA polymerase, eukaryota, Nucleotide-binding alpha-beta plait domain protein [Artemisia annua]|uniref:RNA-directed DNA polymerase, eukaryota, Nucleotide-binding alpha-beta plait domain protein n=1 Tax=Artemisia annua TaxID=35608 RepID=A0A2U1LHP0_ARTAN|nr:RNA-directed DNA polymerase, eukaryota, Nucleotide-binding alpha-beta plait domain protein [Artemisia annua]
MSVEKHRYYLCTRGVLKETGKSITLINVYSPQKLVDKRLLWTELERIIVQDLEYWIVGGDFNCVRDRMERRKSNFIALVTNEFNDFIDKVEVRNYGAKPFRFYNSWLLRSDLEGLVDRTVKDFSGCGPPDIVLMNEFKLLRQEIVKWRKTKGTEEAEEEVNLNKELIELDAMVEDRDLTEAEEWVFVEAKKRLKELEEFKAKDTRQKARGIVGNGRKVKFWIDPWITSEPLKDIYPDLFRLEENKWCYVDEIIGSQHHGRGITWKWKKQPASGSEVDTLINCHRMVADVIIDEKDDRWFWNHGPNVEFSVRDVRKWLKGADVLDDDSRFTWCKWIPNKCNIFM